MYVLLQIPHSAGCLLGAGVISVDALGLVRDELLELLGSLGLRHGDLGEGNLDAHLVILVAGLGASVLLGGAGAATVVKDRDDRGLGGLVHRRAGGLALEEGRDGSGGGTGLDNLAATHIHGHHGGIRGSGADDCEGSESLGHHGVRISGEEDVGIQRLLWGLEKAKIGVRNSG